MNEIDEAIVRIEEATYPDGMPVHNEEVARRRIALLINNAKPGNWAWQELEAIWGFCPDYDINDSGNERN